jgi:hypothetical protein
MQGIPDRCGAVDLSVPIVKAKPVLRATVKCKAPKGHSLLEGCFDLFWADNGSLRDLHLLIAMQWKLVPSAGFQRGSARLKVASRGFRHPSTHGDHRDQLAVWRELPRCGGGVDDLLEIHPQPFAKSRCRSIEKLVKNIQTQLITGLHTDLVNPIALAQTV